ncbi:hypothetical protein KSP40_PGU015682 [Platanthera guangdongensis]|uniref:Uncharacterized protein n=1 Tax=Platanthera guangdongensis TaxID=2320717 RepID=A0ABR2LY65_9ASPA
MAADCSAVRCSRLRSHILPRCSVIEIPNTHLTCVRDGGFAQAHEDDGEDPNPVPTYQYLTTISSVFFELTHHKHRSQEGSEMETAAGVKVGVEEEVMATAGSEEIVPACSEEMDSDIQRILERSSASPSR